MIFIFCLLLLSGIVAGQMVDLSGIREAVLLVTSICLAYIMIEVGVEFSVDKRKITDYGWDSVVAVMAAAMPVLLWFIYFFLNLKSSWQPALLAGLSCAPTSAGVLFSMLMAAGLGATWVFKKARTLAVLDDLATILFLTPLEIVIHGFEWTSIAVIVLIAGFLFVAFRWQNSIHCPAGKTWLLLYAVVLSAIIFVIKKTTNIHVEVLVPAFMWGCLMYSKEHGHPPHAKPAASWLDTGIKGLFMFLVGFSFPKVTLGAVPWSGVAGHVVMLTILSNLGKCVPFFCYGKEASWRERLALSVAMFPRGEVGAAVLLIGIGYGLAGYENTLAVLSLAFNLVLTGVFIWIIIRILGGASVLRK